MHEAGRCDVSPLAFMNHVNTFTAWIFVLSLCSVGAQGTLQYDERSATDGIRDGAGIVVQTNGPIGQSFTPSLSAIGYVKMFFHDVTPGNSLGATVLINVRAGSISGTVLGSTDPVALPDSFNNPTNLFFASPVTLSPGTVYYIEPIVQTGDLWHVLAYDYHYNSGTAFIKGVADPINDLWFEEGIVVPEPSCGCFLLAGFMILRRARKRSISVPALQPADPVQHSF
jgi:hypothetical protein